MREQAAGTDRHRTDRSSEAPHVTPRPPLRVLFVDGDFLISGGRINLSVEAGPLGGKTATVPLPEIHLTDLGQGGEGITAAELTKKLLREVLRKAIPAAQKAVADLGKGLTEAVKDASKDPGAAVDKAAKSVTDLLQKKK